MLRANAATSSRSGALAVQIRDEVAAVLEFEQADVHVTLAQKPRGGITITATA